MTNSSYAFNLSEAWDQSSYGEFINSETKNVYIDTGIGGYQTRMQVHSSHSLKTTNDIFFFVGAKLNKARIQINIPNPSSTESKQTRVDTKFNVYAVAYDVSSHLTLAADYFRIEGYFYQPLGSGENIPTLKFPDLKNIKTTVTAFYTFNNEHTSFVTEPLVFDKRNDSSSWILISKISSTEMSGLSALSSLPDLPQIANYKSSKIYTLESSIGYSKNLFWENWFLGGAIGLGLSANSLKYEYANGQTANENKMGSSYFLSLSTGYIWTRAKLAAFTNQNSSTVLVGDVEFDSSGGTSGIYYGYSF